jgi:hypothetical protein
VFFSLLYTKGQVNQDQLLPGNALSRKHQVTAPCDPSTRDQAQSWPESPASDPFGLVWHLSLTRRSFVVVRPLVCLPVPSHWSPGDQRERLRDMSD